jgi:hypothetical protein
VSLVIFAIDQRSKWKSRELQKTVKKLKPASRRAQAREKATQKRNKYKR